MKHPLASLKILDFSTLLPGPFGSMMLADLGADVLRIEAPNRPDAVRFLPPFDGETSAWHALINRSKRSLALNLKQAQAIPIVHQLITDGGYDIIVEQFRPGVMARLGLDYETLSQINPRLIYCSVTGYGQTGPYQQRAGHDLNYLALAGVLSHSGRADQKPPPLGVQVADIGGGAMGAVIGLLTAVVHRHATGEGQQVDISMHDMAVYWQAHAISQYLVAGEEPAPESWQLNGGIFYDVYETADGRYLSIAPLEPKFWLLFCEAIQQPNLNPLAPDTKTTIEAIIQQKTLADWLAIFQPLDACVEPVQTISQMLDHPQTQARGLVVQVAKPDGTSQPQIAQPLKFSATEPQYQHIGAALGAHTDEVLQQLGYTPEQIEALRQTGAIA